MVCPAAKVPNNLGQDEPLPAMGVDTVDVNQPDWYAWHRPYADPESALSKRLAAVQEQIGHALDRCPAGPIVAVSVCAGQGHDLLGVLAGHERAPDVSALLLELDPRNAAAARQAVAAGGLVGRVTVVEADAARTELYRDVAPADLVLACGVFGNISDADVERTIGFCRQLCRTGGTVLWTRHRQPPDLVPAICGWFERGGFEQVWLSDPAEPFGAGAHRLAAPSEPLRYPERMFTFIRTE